MAKTSQSMDILSLIEAEHREVEDLFEQFQEIGDSKAQIQCFNEIYKKLTLHAQVEELVFYPALQEFEETASYIEEAESEHNGVKVLLEQMKGLNPNDAEFQTKMMHLQENVRHHVEEEESEIFEATRDCMDEEALAALGLEFQEAEARLTDEVEAMLTQ